MAHERGPTKKDLGVICEAVARMLELHGLAHSCIDGAALLATVLHVLGYSQAYPLTVGVSIFNDALRKWLEQHGVPDDEVSAKACDEAGGLQIIVGKGIESTDERWGGHLAIVVPNYFGERHALLDLTICQADNPGFNVVLPLICLKVTDDFIAGKRQFPSVVNDCLLLYEAYPDDHSYGNWKRLINREDVIEAAAQVISKLK